MGRSYGNGFSVSKRPPYGQRNSFQSTASGTFDEDLNGTRIDVTVGLSPVVMIMMACFAMIGVLIANAVAMGFASMEALPVQILARAAATLAVFVLAGAFVGLGRLMAAGETPFLRRTLTETFLATG